jgi:capsid assembly protease
MKRVMGILQGPWAIEPSYLEMMNGIFLDRQSGKLSAEELHDIELAIGKKLDNASSRSYEVQNGVAVVPMIGPMVKRGDFFSNVSGMTSYQKLQADLQQARTDPEVRAIMLDGDTPGGSASGCATTADLIRQIRTEKPMAAWTDGQMTSAGQWIGSATGNVLIANDTTQLGSIGVIRLHQDVSKAEEMRGMKTTVLTAGKYKGVGHPYAPLSVEHQGMINGGLDYMYTAFVNAISEFTGKTVDDVLANMAEGRIFVGKQAVDVGLANKVMSRDDCMAMLCDQVKSKSSTMVSMGCTTAMGGKASAENLKTEVEMTKAELKSNHAALYAEVFAEGQASGGPMCGTCACKDCGGGECSSCTKNPHKMSADNERARVQSVLTLPGAGAAAHKELINKLAFDGKTSAEGAAHQILLSEESLRNKAAEDLKAGATTAAPAAEGGVAASDEVEEQRLAALMVDTVNSGR